MMKIRSIATCAALLLGVAACTDLTVPNENAPSRTVALATAGDVENLVAGAYRTWMLSQHHVNGPVHILSTQAFQHSSTAANFGMLTYSSIPRVPVRNSVSHADYGNIAWTWTQSYRVIAAVSEGLRAASANTKIADDLGAARLARLTLYGRLMLGLAHADLALLYDRAYVVDETSVVVDDAGAPVLLGDPLPYGQVMAAALGYLEDAARLAESNPSGLAIETDWVGTPAELTPPDVARLARSWAAIYRAAVARTPQERQDVDWNAVLADVAAGLTVDFVHASDPTYTDWLAGSLSYLYAWASTWQQVTPFIFGMADQSGNYQRWIETPLAQRDAFHTGTADPVLIVTPDLRFPRGSTLLEQANNWGSYVGVRRAGAPPNATVSNAVQFSRPDRGTWRWSQYHTTQFNSTGGLQVGTEAKIRVAALRLLAAEAHYRLGQLDDAAALINITRELNGLSPAVPGGPADGNSSCVPRLPDGTCGDLLEMLKWEKRMETWQRGPFASEWFFDSRGWGDLYRGTPLHFPIPAAQLHVLGLGPSYTFGGAGGEFAAPRSSYRFPEE